MNEDMDLSIIIVSYNTKEMTLACIKSIYEQAKENSFEILVVDNDSSDGSADAIAKQFPNLKLFALKENLGFAKANNFASQYAVGKYILLLNPDTVVLNNAIDELLIFAENNSKHKLYGGRTLYGDLSLNPTSCWRKPTLWSTFCYFIGLSSLFRHNVLFDPESYGSWERDSIKEVDIVTGCLLMIESSLWHELGGFDESFFMYGEDADLCFRAAKLGAIPIINPDATIIHYCGASEKIRTDKMIRLFRAKKQLMNKHWSSIASFLGKLLLTYSAFLRYVTVSILARINSAKYTEKKAGWQEIWRRRIEW